MPINPTSDDQSYARRFAKLTEQVQDIERRLSRGVVLQSGASVYWGPKSTGTRITFNAALNRYEFYINGALVDTIS